MNFFVSAKHSLRTYCIIFVFKPKFNIMQSEIIIDNIKTRLGIETLNPMQQQMLGTDSHRVVLIAPTGSGKTLAFTCRMLRAVSQGGQGRVLALVLAPSRELVVQIAGVLRQIATGYKTVAFYGGHSMEDEKKSLNPVPDIIVATPGRMLDHMQRGHLDMHGLEVLVLDEYDKSLELGFEGEMKRIIGRIGQCGDIILTSATRLDVMPQYLPMHNAEVICPEVKNDPRGRMQVVRVPSYNPDKLDTLCNLLRTFAAGARTIVFVNHRESAERVYKRLKSEKIDCGLYHGALDQELRSTAIDLFANGTTPILVATDLASRGLDIEGVDNVIHYHQPTSEQAWTHRNGRTARVDATGTVYDIVSESDTVPEYIEFDREYIPDGSESRPMRSDVATLYFAAGKKEKISRGDIVGFLVSNSPVEASEIGRIAVRDHNALAAVPRAKVSEILESVSGVKLKGKKVRISQLRM